MPAQPVPNLKFEIAHVLFIDIVGYSKLRIVTTVAPRDVPVIKEGVATLNRFIKRTRDRQRLQTRYL